MSQTYADIIIDISHSAIDRVFQYRIGDAWKEQVQVGSLVTVPFGKGNAHRHGYVIGITQTPSMFNQAAASFGNSERRKAFRIGVYQC